MDPGDADPERREFLEELEAWTEWPLAILAFAWIALLVLELTGSQSPYIEPATNLIWAIFIIEFLVRLAVATERVRFVRENWLTVIALIVPAFRLFRFAAVLRGAAALRGLRLIRIVTGLNRGMRSWRGALGARHVPFVILFSAMVGLVGAAGIFTFESETNPEFATFGDALWWSGMMLITLGSGGWPETGAGRILGFMIGLYSFTVFGYITAALASILLEHPKEAGEDGETTPRTVMEEDGQ